MFVEGAKVKTPVGVSVSGIAVLGTCAEPSNMQTPPAAPPSLIIVLSFCTASNRSTLAAAGLSASESKLVVTICVEGKAINVSWFYI
jgi:hypothetical protein